MTGNSPEQETMTMRLHTRLTIGQVQSALNQAKARGLITHDVYFAVFDPGRSRTHPHGYDIQLGTDDKHSLPPGTTDQHGRKMRVRRYKNSGSYGATSEGGSGESVWAATWHEWGWFIAEVFAADPGARWGADPARCRYPEYAWGYASETDFHAKTGGVFRLDDAPAPREPAPAPARSHSPDYSDAAYAAAYQRRERAAPARTPDETLARIDAALAGPSLDPTVFGPAY